MSDKRGDNFAQLVSAIASMDGGFQAPKEGEDKGGRVVNEEFYNNINFVVGFHTDLIRECGAILLYLKIAGLVWIPLLYWDKFRLLAALVLMVAIAFSIEIYRRLESLRWALFYRLILVGISLACCCRLWLYPLLGGDP